MARIAADVTWLIGNTPMIELSRLSPPGSRVVAKLEGCNPTGSNKDRAALGMINHALRSGYLPAGGTIVECSSGDLGLAIAMVGRRLGCRVVLTMPEGVPPQRTNLMRTLGAELVLTPAAGGMRGAMERAERLAREIPGAICLQSFTNRANARAHAETTAREIWADTDGMVRTVVAPVGTGGTAAGCAMFLRDFGVAVVGVEPAQSPVLSGGAPGVHDIPGIGAGFVPDILSLEHLDEVLPISDHEARDAVRRTARDEALLIGPAGGAVVAAALHLATRPASTGSMIVAVIPDTAERYFDHPAYQGDC